MQQPTGLGDPFSEIFLHLFCKKIFRKKEYSVEIPCVFFIKNHPKGLTKFFFPKIATTAYNMKGCLMF